jgi:Uma2 family endonuclease
MSTATKAPPPMPPAPREQRTATYSPEDLLTLPDGERFELVNGQLVEKAMSGLSSWVGGETLRRVSNFSQEHQLGWVFGSDCGFQCFPDAPKKVRKPDVAFVAKSKLPNGPMDGHLRVPPDLAVEVVSPTDSFGELDAKVEEYLAAGVLSVWVINPRTRIVQVFRRGNHVMRLHEHDELTEPDILPGFHCRVNDLLPPVSMTDTDTAQSAAEVDMTAAPAE